jgi:hypothetical protein
MSKPVYAKPHLRLKNGRWRIRDLSGNWWFTPAGWTPRDGTGR